MLKAVEYLGKKGLRELSFIPHTFQIKNTCDYFDELNVVMLLYVCELEWALLLVVVVVVVIEVLLLVQTVDSMVIVGDFIQVY